MAKIVKVTVSLDTPSLRHRVYPPEYDKTKIYLPTYESIGDPDTVIARNDGTEYMICVVADSDLASFVASDDIVEIDEATAITLGTQLRPQREFVTDARIVVPIVSKMRLSQALTQEESDAIDPTNNAAGIGLSDSFTDMLTDAKLRVG